MEWTYWGRKDEVQWRCCCPWLLDHMNHSLPFPKAMIWFLLETLTLGLEWNTINGKARSDFTAWVKWTKMVSWTLHELYDLELTSTYFARSLNLKVTWMYPRSRHSGTKLIISMFGEDNWTVPCMHSEVCSFANIFPLEQNAVRPSTAQ